MPKRLALIAFLVLIGLFAGQEYGLFDDLQPPATSSTEQDGPLRSAFENRVSNLQIQGQGEVVKLLADDKVGSRHQRFVLRTSTGQTLLVAHNIDLAPRIAQIQVGDRVEFNGEYEWNPNGGVIHWTHKDPRGRHEAGWLKHKGRVYQ